MSSLITSELVLAMKQYNYQYFLLISLAKTLNSIPGYHSKTHVGGHTDQQE